MKTCVCQVCSSPATIEDFADRVKRKGKQGLYNEYVHIQTNNVKYGTFINSMLERNTTKNRYRDVLCYDQTRVVLSVDKTGDRSSDYINANYVDGYKQKKVFIATQGPPPKTCSDFWRMIWEQQVVVITMTTICMENGYYGTRKRLHHHHAPIEEPQDRGDSLCSSHAIHIMAGFWCTSFSNGNGQIHSTDAIHAENSGKSTW